MIDKKSNFVMCHYFHDLKKFKNFKNCKIFVGDVSDPKILIKVIKIKKTLSFFI